MAGKWDQVVQSEKFQSLDEWKRQEVRGAFFDREIRPKAPADKVDAVQSAFFTRTEPDVFGRRDPEGEGVGAMDYAKELGAGLNEGTGSVLQGVGDLVEQGGQWVDRGLRAIGLGGALDAGDEAIGGASVSEAARAAGKWFGQGGQEMRETQSEAAQKARTDSTPQGDVTKPSTWSMGDDPSIAGYGLQISNLIGQFAPQAAALLAPGGAARAVGMAGVGSMQAGGAAGEDAEQYVMQQSDEDLAKNSGMYRDLVEQGVEPEEAKRQTAVAARGAAFSGAAPVGGAGGALTHYILGPFQKAIGGGVGRRLGYGLAVDSPAEGAQEVAETVAGRAAQNQATQGNRDTTEGTFGDAALGAIAGGGHAALGAAMGERLPQRNRMPTPDDMVRERTPEDIADAEQQYQRDRDAEAQQFVDRRRAEEQSAAAAREQFGETGDAIWQNADNDLPVTVRGIEPEPDQDGRYYARVEREGQESFVPLDELQPVEPPATQTEEAPASPRQPTLGIDNDIRVAERLGADEDATRLRNAKSLFIRAQQADEAGNGSMASRLRQRGIRIHQDIYGNPDTVMPERPASFPVPYEFTGEVEPAARAPAASQTTRQADTYDGTPDPRLNRPAQQLRQGDQATGESLIYGEGPSVRRGNANTGMDQAFENARSTDTRQPKRGSYDPTQATDTPIARRREQTSGNQATAYLPDNTPVPVRYRVMDLDELTPSNDPDGGVNPDFPDELQPRDRTGRNSQVQVRNIAARLNPERLGESTDAGSGSPIVGQDGVVESGNGRTMAIAQAYRSDSPQSRRYRAYVQQRAADLGIDPEVVRGMRQPVLVRERRGSIDRAEFARRANEADVASMTPHEMASSDAERLSADDLAEWSPDESGDPLAASNRAFTRRFTQRMGNNEASRYRNRDGAPSPELGERMSRAIFARAYADEQGRPSPDMVEMVAEQQGGLRNLTLALQDAAPDFAIARERGGADELAMVNTVVDAVRIVRQARSSGISVRELVSQNDAFSDAVPSNTATLAMFLANNARSRSGLRDAMSLMAAATRRRAETSQSGALFDDEVSNEDITNAAARQDQPAPESRQPGNAGDNAGRNRTSAGPAAKGQENAGADTAAQAENVDDDPLLSTYDEQELSDRDQQRANADQQAQNNRQQEASHAQADRDANDFTLTGSDRSADEATARGQSDLLSDPTYSMGAAQSNGTAPSSDQVRTALDGMGERLGDFEVVDSTSELPMRIQLAMAAAGADADGVRGLYDGDRLYIIASNNDSIQRAVMTAVHEAVGHKGIRGVLGDELTPVMRQLYNSLPHSRKGREALSEVLENYPFLDRNNPDDQVMIAEEMVAHLLEKGARPKAWQRAMAAIRNLLRRRFPSIAWTYTDVLALGERSRDYLRQQQDGDSDSISFSLRPKRQPAADQFNDLSDDQKDFMAKFGSKTPTRRAMDWYRDLTSRAMLRIRQGMVDQYAALKELDEKRFGKDGALKENITSSSWVLARMSNAANGALHAMLHNGRIELDPDQKVIDVRDDDSKGLGAVLGRLGSPAEIERFMMWIAANRSDKLKDEGREFLFTDAEIRAGMQLNQGRTADGASRREKYAEAFDEFQQYRDDVLAIAEQSGIIRPDQRAMWRDEFYVPFYRLKDDKDVNVQLGTSGLSRQQAYKRLKGGTDNINDLLQNTMMNFHHLLDASLKNQAAQQAIENAEAMGMARVVPESNRDTAKSTFVMKNGAKSFYEIDDPMVYSALSALAHPGMNNTIMKVMRGFKRVFTNMTTTTPQFIVANLMRDTMQAVATNEVSANVFKNIYEGAGTLRDQRKRARMLAAGGSFNFGHLYSNNPDELRAQLTRNLRDAKVLGVPGSSLKGFAAPAQLIRAGWAKWGDMNDFAENLNRAAIYDQNQDKGKLKAAFEARDLIDFSARGAWPAVRILTDIVPFLNARIQGLDKIYRSGVKPGANVLKAAITRNDATVSDKQAAARFWAVAGAVTMATVALYLNNHDDEDYQKLEEWQKDTYWFFKVGNQAFFIPKPFEVGAIATMAERITQQFVDDEATGSLFAQRMGHMLTGTFAFSPVPQMMQPALDIYSNRDSFTDRPIEGMGDERVSPELRKRDSTSRIAQGASWLLNNSVGAVGNPDTNPMALSPLQIDHLIQGYLGQVGAWAASSVDVAWNTFDGKDEPAKRWYEYQPVRRFYSNLGDEPRYTRYGTVFYEGLREAERAYSDVKELGELGRLEEAKALAKSKADLLRLRKPLMGAQRKLNTVRKQIDAVRRSDLDGELKRQRIDRLTAVKNRIQQILGEKILEQRAAD